MVGIEEPCMGERMGGDRMQSWRMRKDVEKANKGQDSNHRGAGGEGFLV